MRVLITGGAGFIGSTLAEKLLAQGHQVVSLDNLCNFYDPALKRANLEAVRRSPQGDGFTAVEADIRTITAAHEIFRHRFDAVVHIAAMAGVRPSIADPMLYQQVNVCGTQNLLEIAKATQIPKFIFASSSSVYGTNPNVPWREDEPLLPISPYAATKLSCEYMGHVYHHLYGLDFIALRYFTVYGPRQRSDLAIGKFIRAALLGQTVELFGDGSSSRDYTFVTDVADGTTAAFGLSGYHVINIGNSTPVSLLELVATVEHATGKKLKVRHIGCQPGDVERTCASMERAARELDYHPKVTLVDGIKMQCEWYLNGGGRPQLESGPAQ